MSKMRIREAKPFVQDPTAREREEGWNLNPGLSNSKVLFSTWYSVAPMRESTRGSHLCLCRISPPAPSALGSGSSLAGVCHLQRESCRCLPFSLSSPALARVLGGLIIPFHHKSIGEGKNAFLEASKHNLKPKRAPPLKPFCFRVQDAHGIEMVLLWGAGAWATPPMREAQEGGRRGGGRGRSGREQDRGERDKQQRPVMKGQRGREGRKQRRKQESDTVEIENRIEGHLSGSVS